MKIVELRAENFKRLKVVTVKPEKNTVVISGANEQGKTSLLDSIFWVLGGAYMTRATGTTAPIRAGEKKAVVSLDLGDMVATRKATASGETLTVEGKDGAVFKSPQAVLDALVGKIAIDPLSFAGMDEKAQRETLLKLVNIDFDLSEADEARRRLYEERVQCGRELKRLQAILTTLPKPEGPVPKEEANTAAIIGYMKDGNETNKANAIKRNSVENLKANIAKAEQEIDRKRRELDAMKSDLLIAEGEIEGLKDVDVAIIERRLDEVEKQNADYRAAKFYKQAVRNADEEQSNYDSFTKRIDDIDAQKSKALSAAKFPVPGLSFSETGVTFKDVPFSQCSSAERLRVSVAVAMAANPKLRVIRITDGSLIDKKNMEIIEEMAVDSDYQIWIEKVDETGKVGIYIEDGEVKTI